MDEKGLCLQVASFSGMCATRPGLRQEHSDSLHPPVHPCQDLLHQTEITPLLTFPSLRLSLFVCFTAVPRGICQGSALAGESAWPPTEGDMSCRMWVQQANSRSFSETERQHHGCHGSRVFTVFLLPYLILNAAISKV